MNTHSKPDVGDLSEEDVKNRSRGVPDMSNDHASNVRGGDSVVDEEPGPDDDDGLPENARRRVPS
jgi:hypothetical protein